MARRARGGKNRYAWHGFYLNSPAIPADANNDIFVLYDPIDDDHQEEVVLQRVVLHYSIAMVSAAVTSQYGIGVYLVRRDDAGSMVSDINPLGTTAFDIEQNNQLFNRTHFFRPNDADGQPQSLTQVVEVKAKRKIQDPAMLVVVTRVNGTDAAIQHQFTARCLVKEGRF